MKQFSMTTPLKKIGISSLLMMSVFTLTSCASSSKSVKIEQNHTLINSGIQAYVDSDCVKAINLFSQSIAEQKHPVALNGLGISYLQCEQYEQAEEALRQAVSLTPNSAEIQVNLGSALFAQKKYEQAQVAFETALTLSPMLIEAINAMAAIHIINDEPEKAIKLLFNSTKELPLDSPLHYNYALALYEIGLNHDAIKLLESFIEDNEDNAAAHNALAVILQNAKEFDKALVHINRAIELYPIEASFYYNRANILKKINKFEESEKDYGRAIAYDSNMPEAYINRGDLYSILNKTDLACNDLKKACDMGLCDRLKSYKKTGRCLGGIWK